MTIRTMLAVAVTAEPLAGSDLDGGRRPVRSAGSDAQGAPIGDAAGTAAESDWPAAFARLEPQAIRANLLSAALFLFTYEALKDAIVEQTRRFYCTEWDDRSGRAVPNERYESQVLALDPKQKPWGASRKWLWQAGALDADDERALDEVSDVRNRLAHELPEVLLEGEPRLGPALHQILALIAKVDLWFIREIHAPCNPAFDHLKEEDLMGDGTYSMRMAFVGYVTEVITALLGEPTQPDPDAGPDTSTEA